MTRAASPEGGAGPTCAPNVRAALAALLNQSATEEGRALVEAQLGLCQGTMQGEEDAPLVALALMVGAFDTAAMASSPNESSYFTGGQGRGRLSLFLGSEQAPQLQMPAGPTAPAPQLAPGRMLRAVYRRLRVQLHCRHALLQVTRSTRCQPGRCGRCALRWRANCRETRSCWGCGASYCPAAPLAGLHKKLCSCRALSCRGHICSACTHRLPDWSHRRYGPCVLLEGPHAAALPAHCHPGAWACGSRGH